MSKTYLPCDPDQQLLLPAALQEWLPDNHLAYFISDVVNQDFRFGQEPDVPGLPVTLARDNLVFTALFPDHPDAWCSFTATAWNTHRSCPSGRTLTTAPKPLVKLIPTPSTMSCSDRIAPAPLLLVRTGQDSAPAMSSQSSATEPVSAVRTVGRSGTVRDALGNLMWTTSDHSECPAMVVARIGAGRPTRTDGSSPLLVHISAGMRPRAGNPAPTRPRWDKTSDIEAITMKNGRPATRSICVDCGTRKFRIGVLP